MDRNGLRKLKQLAFTDTRFVYFQRSKAPMNKSLSIPVALLMALSTLLASCGGAATPAPAASGAVVTINTFSPQDPNTDLATNAFTKEVEQKFNIKFVWQTTTMDGNAAKEKRQISLASGDYPDLYLLIPWVDQFSQTDI